MAGIERIPVTTTFVDDNLYLVRRVDLELLEDRLGRAREVVAICSPDGIHWDDPDERAEFFAEATALWDELWATLPGDGTE